MNFTAKEVLPSLLDKSKTQTMRKAWHDSFSKRQGITDKTWPKDAKFKVGDEVPIVWDEESDEIWFNKESGEPRIPGIPALAESYFNKNIGKIKITEVFKVKIGYERLHKKADIAYFVEGMIHCSYEDFSKRDGFSSLEDMFVCLHRIYNLFEPRDFWVYRWEWI